jgi:hypothetical protein
MASGSLYGPTWAAGSSAPWAIVAAAVNEREVAGDLPQVGLASRDLLADKGFSEITVQMDLARHGARTFWGLLTRTAAIIATDTMLLVCLTRD